MDAAGRAVSLRANIDSLLPARTGTAGLPSGRRDALPSGEYRAPGFAGDQSSRIGVRRAG